MLAAQSGQHGFILIESSRTGVYFRTHFHLRLARCQFVVLPSKVFQTLFNVAHLLTLLRNALRDALRYPLDTVTQRLDRLPGGIEAAGELVAQQEFYFNGFRHSVYFFVSIAIERSWKAFASSLSS